MFCIGRKSASWNAFELGLDARQDSTPVLDKVILTEDNSRFEVYSQLFSLKPE